MAALPMIPIAQEDTGVEHTSRHWRLLRSRRCG
jgi:hypothetical protein